MKIINIEKSYENCTEIGWVGYDIYFSEKIDEFFVKKLETLGELMYLKNLKTPFFKLDSKDYMIKGNLNHNKIRIGLRNNNKEYLEKIVKELFQ